MTEDQRSEGTKPSDRIVRGGIVVYVGAILMLISFASPYWVKTIVDPQINPFRNMGLWEYCFDNFLYPYHQFPYPFNGCHYVYSYEFYVLREWILPKWILIVQTFITLGFILTYSSLILIALIVTRYPLKFVLRYEWLLSGCVFLCVAVSGFLQFLGVLIFGTQSSRRDWLQYPNFNYLSWSYYCMVISLFLHAIASKILYTNAKKSWDKREEKWNLVMQMYPRPDQHGFM